MRSWWSQVAPPELWDHGLGGNTCGKEGVDEINELTQPIQDRVLKEMQLEAVLGGVSA